MNDEKFLWTMTGLMAATLISILFAGSYVIGDMLGSISTLKAQVSVVELRQDAQAQFNRLTTDRFYKMEKK